MSINTALQSNMLKTKPKVLPGWGKQTSIPKTLSTKAADSPAVSNSNSNGQSVSARAASNMETMKRAAAFTGNSNSNSIYPYVGAKANPSVNDFTIKNVVHVDSGNYMPTPRSMDRMYSKLADMQQAQMNRYSNCNNNRNTTGDVMSTMAALNQLGTQIGGIVKATQSSNTQASTKSSQSASDVEVRNNNGAEVNNVLNSLATAKTSKEVQSGLSTVSGQITAKTKLSQGYTAQIQTDTASKTTAEGVLGQIKVDIASTKQSISSLGIQMTSLESKIALAKAAGQDTTALTTQLNELKTQKETAEAKLKELDGPKGTREQKETEITNLDQSIKDNTKAKEKNDSEVKQLNNAENKYKAQQTKMEQTEQKDMSKLYGKLSDIGSKLAKEKDENKKQKLIEEYKGIAPKYNSLLDGTSVKHNFQKVADEPQV